MTFQSQGMAEKTIHLVRNTGIKLIVIITLLPTLSFGQLQLVRYDSIPVTEGSFPLINAWAGGFNSPQFSEIDLNGDGINDLFAFERNWYGMVKTFINFGTNDQVDYVYDAGYQHKFPAMHNWTLLADYNCDGKNDIFTSVPAGAAVYRNDYDPVSGLNFTLVAPLLLSKSSLGLTPLYVSPPDIPAIKDIDGDGDMDILSFDVLGNAMMFHKNMSVEKYDNCNSLEFDLDSECWGYFSESSLDNTITLFDTCSNVSTKTTNDDRHAGSATLAIDLNGNGLQDLLIGDISYNNIVSLNNGGTIENSSMISQDANFPSYSTPVDLTVFPAAYYLDVNNDEKKDLLISPNNPNTSENFNNIWYYKNVGTESVPDFEFQNYNFLQGEMIDVGEGARPVFFDANSDGLLDIVIGNFGYFVSSNTFESKLALLLNTGTLTIPSFDLVERDYAGLASLNINSVYPSFGDLDNDGDKDMIIGDEEGHLHYFINTAGAGLPAEFSLSKPNYMNIDVGETAMPQLVDVNHDEKLDLLVGERSGTIAYFENIGSTDNASFNSSPTNDLFGDIDVMPECCSGYSSPFLTVDSVGDNLLYVGSEQGMLYQFNNIEGNLNGSFNLVDSLFLSGLNVTISGADLNNNGSTELIYGEYAGGIAVLKKGNPKWISIKENNINTFEVDIFPNPAKSSIYLQMKTRTPYQIIEVQLQNFLGQVISTHQYTYSGNKINIDLIDTSPGIYFIHIQTEGFLCTKKLVVR
jgi:hypothetical protein